MPTANVVPNADVTTQWDTIVPGTPTTHFDKIDEGTASPDDADYIETVTVNDQDQWALGDSPANLSELTQIAVNFRARITDVSATAKIRLELFHTGSTAVTGNPKDVVGADLGGYGVLGTTTKTWTGLSLTKAQADSLELRATFLGS